MWSFVNREKRFINRDIDSVLEALPSLSSACLSKPESMKKTWFIHLFNSFSASKKVILYIILALPGA